MKIRKRKGIKGITYYLDYRVNGFRRVESLGKIAKHEAELVKAQRQREIAEGQYPIIKSYKKILFFDICNEFLQWSRVHKRSFKRDGQFIKHLQSFFGNIPLYRITRKSAEDYMAWRSVQKKGGGKLISKSTTNKEIACLKKIINKTVEWGKARANPISRIKMFKLEERKPRFLNEKELGELIEYACEPLKPIIIIAALTGMRRGEILNLKWKSINFDLGLVYVEKTKSGKDREIPMAPDVKKILWELRERSNNEYVFVDKNGNPYRYVVRFWFDKAVKDSGIKDCTFHTLRHTFASNLVKCNINLKVIQELLGHCSLSVTMKYAHLSPGLTQQAVQMLNTELGLVKKWSKKAIQSKSLKVIPSKVLENQREYKRPRSSIGQSSGLLSRRLSVRFGPRVP